MDDEKRTPEAQKFSLEDILAEYSSKRKAGKREQTPEIPIKKELKKDAEKASEKAEDTGVLIRMPVSDAPKQDTLRLELSPKLPGITADELDVGGIQGENVLDLDAYDKVYTSKQQKIESLKKRILYENLEKGEESEPPAKKIKLSKIKTVPAPLDKRVKKEFEESSAEKKAPNIKLAEPEAQKKETSKPQINPRAMLGRLERVKGGVAARAAAAILLTLPLLYLTAALRFPLPLPDSITFENSPAANIAMSLSLLFSVCIAGYDVILNGAYGLVSFRASGDTLVFASALASIAYCIYALAVKSVTLYPPVCALPALAVSFSMYSRCVRNKACFRSIKAGVKLKAVRVLSSLPEKYEGETVYATARAGSLQGFFRSFTENDISAPMLSWLAPALCATALFLAVYCSTAPKNPAPFMWCLALMFSLLPCLGFFVCSALPYAKVSKRLYKNGVLTGGEASLMRAGSRAYVLVNDFDIFTESAVTVNGYRLIDPSYKNAALEAAASVLDAAHSVLSRPFARLASDAFVPISPVSELKFSDAGGISAKLGDSQILVGNANFMAFAGIGMPEDIKLKTAVFLAADGHLLAVFAVKYQTLPQTDYSFGLFEQNGYIPIIATRDFNINTAFLKARFDVEPSALIFPTAEVRAAMSDPSATLDSDGIIITRNSGECMAETLLGCRRFSTAAKAGLIMSAFSAVFGVGLSGLMAYGAWTSAASPFNLLAYYLLWSLPALLFTGWVNKY